MKKKCIIISGSIMSNIGKGVLTASLSSIYRNPFLIKVDPYLNIHAGYFNPREHGEVYVTHDGKEADLDLGYYEKFNGKPLSKDNVLTGGKINQIALRIGTLMKGKTCRLRDVMREVYSRYFQSHEFIITEFGGTIDDEEYYWLPYLLELLYKEFDVTHIHVLPVVKNLTGEIKSKPIQNSLKYLQTISFPADIIFLRCRSISESNRNYLLDKIDYVRERVYFLKNFSNIYLIPNYLDRILHIPHLNRYRKNVPYKMRLIQRAEQEKRIEKRILLVNKYSNDMHVYWHLIETIKLQCLLLSKNYKVKILNLYVGNTIDISVLRKIRECEAVIMPGGFGERGWRVYRIIFWLTFKIRSKKILGICWGKQAITCCLLNLHGWENADTQEFDPEANVYLLDRINLGNLKLRTDSNKIVYRRFRNRYHLSIEASHYLEGIVEPRSYDQHGKIQSYDYRNRVFACQFHPEFYYNYKDIDVIVKDFIGSILGEK